MKAAVLKSPGRIELVQLDPPAPGPGEVLLRLEGCGVCASSLPLWQGRPWFEYPAPPGAPGHEGWGTVAAVGPDVQGLAAGDRVTGLSYRAHAQYDLANAEHLVKLPEVLDGLPVPGEPLGCAANIFERADIAAGQTVAIVGIGFLGALLTQLATRAGARVIALSRRPYALEVARRQGAELAVCSEDLHAASASVMQQTAGRGCERVIEAVGYQHALDLASSLVAERGRLVIAGFHQDGSRQVDMQSWNWRGIDVVNAHERDPARYVDGMRKAVDWMASGLLDPAPLLTHALALPSLGKALDLARERPDGFLKAWVAA